MTHNTHTHTRLTQYMLMPPSHSYASMIFKNKRPQKKSCVGFSHNSIHIYQFGWIMMLWDKNEIHEENRF